MQLKRGFTLLELLMAAVLLAILAMFATRAFRQSSSDTRVQDAKARVNVVAMAVKRFLIDNPVASSSVTAANMPLTNAGRSDGTCDKSHVVLTPEGKDTYSLQNLVNCGYLEYREYLDNGNFDFWLKKDGNGVWTCMRAKTDGKIVDQYKDDGQNYHYSYCHNGISETETF